MKVDGELTSRNESEQNGKMKKRIMNKITFRLCAAGRLLRLILSINTLLNIYMISTRAEY